MITRCIMIFVVITATSLAAKEKDPYPLPIPGGKTVTFPGTAKDTFWVLKDSQYKKAIEIVKLQEIDSLKVAILEQKDKLREQIATEKDSIISSYKRGYVHYRDLWGETDVKLEKAEIKASRNWKIGFTVGIAVTAGIVVFSRNVSIWKGDN